MYTESQIIDMPPGRVCVKIPFRYSIATNYTLRFTIFANECVNMPLKTNKNLPMVARSVLSPVCRVRSVRPLIRDPAGRSVWTSSA